jgi:hypothetical protein
MKQGPVVEGLYKGGSLSKVGWRVAEKPGGQTKKPRSETLPVGLKDIPDDRMQPVADRLNLFEDLFGARCRQIRRKRRLCELLLRKHETPLLFFVAFSISTVFLARRMPTTLKRIPAKRRGEVGTGVAFRPAGECEPSVAAG